MKFTTVRNALRLSSFTGFLLLSAAAVAQNPPAASLADNGPEISQTDVVPTFKVRVNQVLVRVVVRDSKGNAIGGLKREDFLLLDSGKPQPITSFTETKEGKTGAHATALQSEISPELNETPTAKPGEIPSRFLVLLFDDLHLSSKDLPYSRAAADELIDHSLTPSERVAIFTTSGLGWQQFTDDRAALHAAVQHLKPESVRRETASDCPYMNYYFANLIENTSDPGAMSAAIQQTLKCTQVDPTAPAVAAARSMVESAARQALSEAGMDRKVLLSALKSSIHSVAGKVGQREIILISPGFFSLEDHQDLTDILEEALHMGVVVDALDSRGLWTDPIYDASVGSNLTSMSAYMRDAEMARSDSPAEIADTTGGKFFHNNNDLNAGMRLLASEPESTYLLAFTPQNLKSDGKFHTLKVKLNNHLKYEVSARKGYYAAQKKTNAEEAARQEVEDTLYSQEELLEIPLEVHTQFFKLSENSSKLSVIVRFNANSLHFRRVDERNMDSVTELCGIFDRNGQFVSGVQKEIHLRLREATLTSLRSGIAVKSDLDVKPGSYLVRVVLRDKEGQQISARSIAVEIP